MSDVVDIDERAERGAYNQALFREVNEQIQALLTDPNVARDFGAAAPAPEWVCECANVGCMERVPVTADGYAFVRAIGSRFLVSPDEEHVFTDIEDVVDRFTDYWVVEKTGRARETAEAFYERSRH
jgi:hypothetical protein